jgi:hypothetical protein
MTEPEKDYARSFQRSSGCPLCDLKVPLHEDAKGFHHISAVGERVACSRTVPVKTEAPNG